MPATGACANPAAKSLQNISRVCVGSVILLQVGDRELAIVACPYDVMAGKNGSRLLECLVGRRVHQDNWVSRARQLEETVSQKALIA